MWTLATHSDDGTKWSLVNLGAGPANRVRVKLFDGPDQRPSGTLVLGRIAPGSAVDLYRFSPDLDLPRWDRVTVTWRLGHRWFPGRLLQWDSDSEASSTASDRP
jgi:hypothetical protein